jgi:hypothetical protein
MQQSGFAQEHGSPDRRGKAEFAGGTVCRQDPASTYFWSSPLFSSSTAVTATVTVTVTATVTVTVTATVTVAVTVGAQSVPVACLHAQNVRLHARHGGCRVGVTRSACRAFHGQRALARGAALQYRV